MIFSRGKLPRIAVPFTILTVSLLLACFAFVSSQSVSAAPTTMNFQGRLADSSGNIMPNGSYNMQFRLFTVASGGSATWTETRETTNRVTVTNGLFSVQLGSVTPLSASLFSGNDVYFEITLPTPATATCGTASCASWESPLSPRHKMATSAYAFQAENANTLDGLDSTAFGQLSGNNSWTGTNTVATTNAAAFRVQNAGGTALMTADTSSGVVLLGQASTLGATLRFSNATNANTISIVSGTTSASYTLTLPTALGSTGECLSNTGSGVLGWASCGGGGGSSSKKITLTPEYAGAVLKADGTNNNGTMTSDFISGLTSGEGYKHTFYDWTTSQGTAQDYDIYITHQLPSDFNATTEFDANSWKIWTYVDHLANSAITMTVYDADGTACANGVSVEGGSTGWSQITLTDFDTNANCDFTANSVITIKLTLSSTSPSTNHVRVAGIEYAYTN